MPRFFTTTFENGYGFLLGENAKHVSKSLRVKTGKELTLCDGKGTDYFGPVEEITKEYIKVKIEGQEQSRTEPTIGVHLYQALPKGDKMELIVQKSVELGVREITPVVTEFCVSRPDSKSLKKKEERWQKIALEAAKQSGRGRVPLIHSTLSFGEYLQQVKETHTVQHSVCYEKGGIPLGELVIEEKSEYTLFVGSEGGFSLREIEEAQKAGVAVTTLGPRILRCETAPLAVLSVMMYLSGNMHK